MRDIIINNPTKLEETKKKILADGLDKLQILSDFDKTLTSCFTNGEKITSLISILRDEHYLTANYSQKAQALFDKYHPLEIDPNLPIKIKADAMLAWWTTHYDLLIESGLNKSDLAKVASSDKISFRSGALEFFDFLHDHNIPLIILSAAGVGSETISLYLKKHGKLYQNIQVVSNEFIWNEKGFACGVKKPIIHSLNKNFNVIKNFPFYQEIKNRKNIILLGDSISDAEMINGFDYNNIIKIGFLNENTEGEISDYKKNYDIIIANDGPIDHILESFQKSFDVIVLDDGPMTFLNSLLFDLIPNK